MSYATTQVRDDGFGAQFQTIIYGILISETNGIEYLHTPIKTMEHNYDNDNNFLNKIENLMNIRNHYKCIDNVDNLLVQELLPSTLINQFESRINFYLSCDSLKKVKDIFWKNKDINFFKNNKYNVAVHIRRPNLKDGMIEGRTDTPLEYYFNIINGIREKYPEKELMFHIYSQNNISDYYSFIENQNDLCFHLNENLVDTFTGMVAADALVTSRSSFSYCAAILSDGEIYYKSFWHPPGEKWIVM